MIYVGLVTGIFLLDFFIKRYIDKKYARKERHCRLGGLVYIEKYYNKGAMLNFLGKNPGILKFLQTAMMLVVCIWFYISLHKNEGELEKLGIAFLLGGGLSNLYDRYTKGHVVDYIRFDVGPKYFQKIIFNISDFFIFIGAVLSVIGNR